VRLHQARFGDRAHGGGCFADPRFETFLRAATERLAARRQARLVWCEVDGEPIAIQLLLTAPGSAAMYQSGFDPRYRHLEPGYLLYALSFRALIAEGIAKFDFLRGNEPYKATWLAQPTPLTRLIAVAPRSSAQLRYYSWQWARLLKRSALATWRGGRSVAPAESAEAPVACVEGGGASPLVQPAVHRD
jgi:CelD/BcsL family acetyltransferase involved in cellulose biosynthesis